MTAPSAALQSLQHVLDAPRQQGIPLGNWRWAVRQRLAAVRDALTNESDYAVDGWLAARRGAALRERNALLTRLTVLGSQVLESPDVEQVREDLRRLMGDISHHIQRLHDLAYDEVELELGGSE